MKAKLLDLVAKWIPAALIPPPVGLRCPRCHRSNTAKLWRPCALCNPQHQLERMVQW